jgi:hypothetical protein
MLSHFLKLTSFGLLVLCLIWSATCLAANRIDIIGVNEVRWQENATKSVLLLINLQVFLARAHVSPGEIDGTFGENSRKAVSAFRQTRGLPPGDQLDEQLWHTLVEENGEPPLTTYPITDKDVAGPFVKRIPADFQKEAAMERLGYTSPEELLAEKFHMSQKLLRRLNR